jgi:hypothetical protein
MYLENGFDNSRPITGMENLENFIEYSPVGIHIVNDEGIILFANSDEGNGSTFSFEIASRS